MRKRIELDVLGDEVNEAVVQLPWRRFPGIVIQGDSLSILVATARRAREALRLGSAEDAADELEALTAKLTGYQAAYESALEKEDIKLPYVKSDG